MSVVSLFNDRPKKPAAGSCPTTDRNENKTKINKTSRRRGEKFNRMKRKLFIPDDELST